MIVVLFSRDCSLRIKQAICCRNFLLRTFTSHRRITKYVFICIPFCFLLSYHYLFAVTYIAGVMSVQYNFNLGAHYIALHPQLSLSSGEGTQSCGEDAYFISKRKNTIGISDGVSAWSAYGLGNSGYVAFYLMSNARVAVEKRDVTDTEKIIQESFNTVWDLHDNKLVNIPNGSATITILHLNYDSATSQPFIQYSNLGDCMVMIIRPESPNNSNTALRIVHQSKKLYAFHEHANGVPVPLQLVFYPAQGRTCMLFVNSFALFEYFRFYVLLSPLYSLLNCLSQYYSLQ